MEKLAYILSGDGISLSEAVTNGLLLTEFACYQATLAGLCCATEQDCKRHREQGGIFLRADADLDPFELAKVLRGKGKENVRLTSSDGDTLGYVLDAEHAADLHPKALSHLPGITLKHSVRITNHNYVDIHLERQAAIRQKYLEDGVFFESESVTLSPLYSIGSGTFIGSGTTLSGSGTIGENCAITGSCSLHNVTLSNNVRINRSVLMDCSVDEGTTVGPFAYLRPNTKIGKNARIGDFVEIKNSVIDDGTKVSHLTYVGDSDVGKGVNFGCGTVTSNYDGMHKYRTVIGNHAFIGCNTNLVAPVKVGDNAYIAAGSTVTEDIPDGALAIARQRQTNKENWVQKNKPELIK